jgi:DUF4097 and DUF4098 domain-containing protein YvlB
MPTFQTPEPITAEIEAGGGAIHVVATDRKDTVVKVRPCDDSRAADVRAAEQTRVHYRDGKLDVSAGRPGLRIFRDGAVEIDIALPSRSRLQVSLASADVRAQGEFGDCRFSSASGELDIDAVAGHVKAATASGSVAVRTAEGSVSVSTASGRTTIGELDGDLKFKAASGGLTIDRMRGNLESATASGSVSIASAGRGTVVANTSNGEVQIGIPEGTAAQLDIMTGSGVVTNRLQPSDGPAERDETLLVRIRSGSGDVDIHRAVEAQAH